MKKLLLSVISIVLTLSVFAQVDNIESFDNTVYPPMGWTSQSSGSYYWSRVTSGTNPTCTPHSGAGMIYFNSYSATSGTTATLITPSFDLSAIGADSSIVAIWVYRDNGYSTNADKVEVYFNTMPVVSGATLIGTINRSMTLSPVETVAGWHRYILTIPIGNNGSTNYLLFKATSAYGNNIFVDDIYYQSYPAPNDVGVTSLLSPVGRCGMSATDSVTIIVNNFGGQVSEDTIPVAFFIDGVNFIQDTIFGSIPVNGQVQFTFSQTVDLTTPGTYEFTVLTSVSGDANAGNDALVTSVTSIPLINSYPYFENFEATDLFWTSSGNLSSWELGIPSGTIINSAYSGTHSWCTNLDSTYNDNENSYVLGPCFDFSSLSMPVFEMKAWWDCENSYDGAAIQYSIDGGTTWTHLGLMGDQTNWYNDSTISGLSFSGKQHGWTGSNSSGLPSNGWVNVKHDFSAIAGQPDVKLRIVFGADGSSVYNGFAFDDISIYDLPGQDVGVTAIVAPVSGCNPSDSITITVKNYGSDATNDTIPVHVSIDGGTTFYVDTIFASIPVGDDTTFTLSQTIDATTINLHNCIAYTDMTGDMLNLNDTLTYQFIYVSEINAFPFYENFNSGNTSFFTLKKGAQSDISIADNSGNYVAKFQGGSATGWTGASGSVTYNNAWNDNVTHIASLSSCNVDATSLTSLELIFDLKQLHSGYNPDLSWFRVIVDGVVIYDVNGDSIYHPATSGSDVFTQRKFDLSAFAGTAFNLTFQSSCKFSEIIDAPGDIALIDNIMIREKPAIDVEITSILSPNSGCGSVNDSITVVIQNNAGVETNDTIPLLYSIDGGITYLNDTIFGVIQSGQDTTYTISSYIDLSVPDNYDIVVIANLQGDNYNNNDTIYKTIETIGTINTFPFVENFSLGQTYYFTLKDGTQSDISIADVSGNKVVRMEGGTSTGWTGSYGSVTYNNAWNDNTTHITSLSSCNIDATALSSLELKFDLKQTYSTYGADYSWFRVLVNGIIVYDNNGDSIYHPATVSSDGFVQRIYDLSAYAGTEFNLTFQSSCKYSEANTAPGDKAFIDNIILHEKPVSDVGVNAVISPISGCGLTANEAIKVQIKNYSNLASNDTIPVFFSIDGGLTFVSDTIFGVLNAGTDTIFTMVPVVDLSLPGIYDVVAFTNVSDDGDHTNDTLFTQVNAIVLVNSFPYFEDFETPNHGWVAGGTYSSWELGTPAASVINTAASGINSWTTNLDGTYNSNENSWVESPCFDFSGIIEPFIEMKVWYESESGYDGAALQYSIDGGTTWAHAGTIDTLNNWYNDNSVGGLDFTDSQDGWAGDGTDGSGGWLTAKQSLAMLSGQSDVKLRVAFGADGSVDYDGFAFDSVAIYENAKNKDLMVIDWLSPLTSCGLTAGENVTIRIKNNGVDTVNTFTLTYSVDSGLTTVSQLFNQQILPGDTAMITFAQTADLSVFGTYYCIAKTELAGDEDLTNDSLMYVVNSVPLVDAFPYFEDFETGNGGWISDGINDSWAFGTPAGTVINSAASGTHAWVTNLTGSYNNDENSWIESPCIDLSSLTNPMLEMKLWWLAENGWDGAAVQYSTDGGSTWTILGNVDDNYNWYNNNSIDGLDFTGSMIGWCGTTTSGTPSDGWVMVKHTLTGLGGQPDVKIRVVFGSDGSSTYEGIGVDDIQIYEAQSDIAIVYPTSGSFTLCNLTATEPIMVVLQNSGDFNIPANDTIYLHYNIDGGAYVDDTLILSSDFAVDDTLSYTFSQTADLSPVHTYTISGYIEYSGDMNQSNDSIAITISSIDFSIDLWPDTITLQSSQLPYLLDASGSYTSYLWQNGYTGALMSANAPGWYSVTVTNAAGCTASDSVYIDVVLKSDAVASANNVNVFPNPNSGKFYITSNFTTKQNIEIELLDVNSRVLMTKSYKNASVLSDKFDIGNLPKGLYYLKIKSDNSILYKKLVVE